jgi:CBS domain-containing protein
MHTGRTLGHICGSGRLFCVSGTSSVAEAARAMRGYNVGAVMVTEGQRLEGILSERDVTFRVVAEGHDPQKVRVAEVMTTDLVTCGPSTPATQALQMMQAQGIRHLPVVEADGVVGMVSLRDFLGREMTEVQDEMSFEGAVAEELW